MKALETKQGAGVISRLIEQLQQLEGSPHARKATGSGTAPAIELSIEEKLAKLEQEANKLAQLGARRKLGIILVGT